MERTDAAVNAATDCENDFQVSFLFAIQNVRKMSYYASLKKWERCKAGVYKEINSMACLSTYLNIKIIDYMFQ